MAKHRKKEDHEEIDDLLQEGDSPSFMEATLSTEDLNSDSVDSTTLYEDEAENMYPLSQDIADPNLEGLEEAEEPEEYDEFDDLAHLEDLTLEELDQLLEESDEKLAAFEHISDGESYSDDYDLHSDDLDSDYLDEDYEDLSETPESDLDFTNSRYSFYSAYLASDAEKTMRKPRSYHRRGSDSAQDEDTDYEDYEQDLDDYYGTTGWDDVDEEEHSSAKKREKKRGADFPSMNTVVARTIRVGTDITDRIKELPVKWTAVILAVSALAMSFVGVTLYQRNFLGSVPSPDVSSSHTETPHVLSEESHIDFGGIDPNSQVPFLPVSVEDLDRRPLNQVFALKDDGTRPVGERQRVEGESLDVTRQLELQSALDAVVERMQSSFTEGIYARVGVAVPGPRGIATAGQAQLLEGWSTIKVPIALAAAQKYAQTRGIILPPEALDLTQGTGHGAAGVPLNPDLETGNIQGTLPAPTAVDNQWLRAQIDAAISRSDNDAAHNLWRYLGADPNDESVNRNPANVTLGKTEFSHERAVQAIQATMHRSGAAIPALTEDSITAEVGYGDIAWSLSDQVRFAHVLACQPESQSIWNSMSDIVESHRWGMGVDENAVYKGGWGPNNDQVLTYRQFGVVGVPGKQIPVALAIESQQITDEAMEEILSIFFKQLQPLLPLGQEAVCQKPGEPLAPAPSSAPASTSTAPRR